MDSRACVTPDNTASVPKGNSLDMVGSVCVSVSWIAAVAVQHSGRAADEHYVPRRLLLLHHLQAGSASFGQGGERRWEKASLSH